MMNMVSLRSVVFYLFFVKLVASYRYLIPHSSLAVIPSAFIIHHCLLKPVCVFLRVSAVNYSSNRQRVSATLFIIQYS